VARVTSAYTGTGETADMDDYVRENSTFTCRRLPDTGISGKQSEGRQRTAPKSALSSLLLLLLLQIKIALGSGRRAVPAESGTRVLSLSRRIDEREDESDRSADTKEHPFSGIGFSAKERTAEGR
jgi:hypothetical protein